MEPRLEPVAKDYRGESWRIVFPDNREALLIFTKAGFLRGGHSHSKPEVSLLLTGKVRNWKIIDNVDESRLQEVITEKSAGEFMINQAGEPHLTLALEDCWLVDWKIDAHIGEWITTDYEPYRMRVRDQLNTKVS
jgi:hypothetical protein